MNQLPQVVDIIAQAIENAVIAGQNQTTLITATKTLLSSLPAQAPEQLIASLPAARREAFTKQFSS